MKKLIMLATMLVTVLTATIPAMAQISLGGGVEQSSEQSSPETGEISLATSATDTGNNSSQCAAPTQFGNTGQPEDQLDAVQYGSILDDLEAEVGSVSLLQLASKADDLTVDGGTPMSFTPAQEASCEQDVQQAAGAAR
jgi:hypothetical protein